MVKGCGPKRFPRYQAFYELNRMGHSWHTSGETSWSVLLIGSCHKNHEYIWFRGGYLNGYQDIKQFMK